MTRSMTGFSSVSQNHGSISFTIQIRSENSKSIEIAIHDESSNYGTHEKLKKIIMEKFDRGKIRIFISIEKEQKFEINNKIKSYLAEFSSVAKRFQITPTISSSELNNMINDNISSSYSSTKLENHQIKLLNKAIKKLIISQEIEGKNLIKDINKKLSKIYILKEKIIKRVSLYRNKLEKKYHKEAKKGFANHDPLLARKEISSALDKVDIEEEIIRLDSHVLELKKILSKKGQKGMTIDFYMQEINREANTLAAKSKDFKLSELAIEIKTNLNQIREIAANIS